MTAAKTANARWAVEIEHVGNNSPDYFSIDSLLVDGEGIHLQVVGGPVVEYARASIRKILVMRVNGQGDKD